MVKILSIKNKEARYKIKKKGKYLLFVENFSGDLKIEIENEGVRVFVIGFYFGRGEDSFKIRTVQHHKKGNSSSDLLIKGVFLDSSSFYYEGLIRIEKQANKSFAYQSNQNLVLSSRSFVESKPYLEILANDVFCTHASTTSYLDRNKLYYLESRGLDKKKGKKLLIESFFAEVFEKINQVWGKKRANSLVNRLKREYIQNLI